MSRIAVSTLVLAAMAVSAGAEKLVSCPLGRQIDLERPVLPWMARDSSPIPKGPTAARPAKLTLTASVGDGAALVRMLARTELPCGSDPRARRGQLIVRVTRGEAMVIATGLAARTAACLQSTISQLRFTRVADGTFARIEIEVEP